MDVIEARAASRAKQGNRDEGRSKTEGIDRWAGLPEKEETAGLRWTDKKRTKWYLTYGWQWWVILANCKGNMVITLIDRKKAYCFYY